VILGAESPAVQSDSTISRDRMSASSTYTSTKEASSSKSMPLSVNLTSAC